MHYRPTVLTPTEKTINSKRSGEKVYRNSSFQKKRAKLYEPLNVEIEEDKIKEEVLLQIYETRQKFCLKKVILVGADLMLKPPNTQHLKLHSSYLQKSRPRSVHKGNTRRNHLSLSLA